MGSAGIRSVLRPRITSVGLCALLLVSCGDSVTPSGSTPEPPTNETPSFEELFGTVLLEADGSEVTIAALNGKAVIGIYFAASTCPACGAFTPELVRVYNELRTGGKSFEVVLASVDADADAVLPFMQKYGMPWLAVPHDRSLILGLAGRWGIQWVPTLVVIDSRRRTITTAGRGEIVAKGAGAYEDWLAAGAGS